MSKLRDTLTNITLPSERVEWRDGVTVEVRGMTVGEQRGFLTRLSRKGEGGDTTIDQENWVPELLIAMVRDPEDGKRVFDPADRDVIKAMRADEVQAIAAACMRLGGFVDNDRTVADLKVMAPDAGA
jgi:hypothetical protein